MGGLPPKKANTASLPSLRDTLEEEEADYAYHYSMLLCLRGRREETCLENFLPVWLETGTSLCCKHLLFRHCRLAGSTGTCALLPPFLSPSGICVPSSFTSGCSARTHYYLYVLYVHAHCFYTTWNLVLTAACSTTLKLPCMFFWAGLACSGEGGGPSSCLPLWQPSTLRTFTP